MANDQPRRPRPPQGWLPPYPPRMPTPPPPAAPPPGWPAAPPPGFPAVPTTVHPIIAPSTSNARRNRRMRGTPIRAPIMVHPVMAASTPRRSAPLPRNHPSIKWPPGFFEGSMEEEELDSDSEAPESSEDTSQGSYGRRDYGPSS